ncbi:hypothetical protein G3I60_23515 [Streptomyces sp. SID13666]|uniref:hypothetical protein n=1 Tax=Streptomyces TaxID=1883 RepID=UPI00110685EA|nr:MULTISPECIES: hypothetical protein [Streptomyces]MCZ4096182.1 hypothetical protein [Streptomyces sp. H39-C1]NEA57029.1 hypothetical protein [Streptomyces sp. SID13666]NEA76936.1 hypothetical protein [Streptomyces sp. SID13588]QNA72750.1 hypothetical protein C8250_013250 [Streptomyces sp. So13.3]
MQIDWQALGTVLGVTLAVTIGLVGVFTLGIVGLAKRESGTDGAAVSGGSAVLTRTGAYACFALCAAAVAYGIFLIVA